jgi:hypothetical protein
MKNNHSLKELDKRNNDKIQKKEMESKACVFVFFKEVFFFSV